MSADAIAADAIAAAVLACRSVAGLSGAVATYLPGRPVTGVRVASGGPVVVHVVGHYGPTVAQIAAEVTAAVRDVAGPVDVRVGVDDLLLPDSSTGVLSWSRASSG